VCVVVVVVVVLLLVVQALPVHAAVNSGSRSCNDWVDGWMDGWMDVCVSGVYPGSCRSSAPDEGLSKV
jgi:hypothetical protein